MVALSSIIDKQFIDRVGALSSGETRSGSAVARAITSSGPKESRIRSSFRFGAQFYAKALSGISFAGSLINFARSDLEQLGSITEKMIGYAEEATKASTSKQRRRTLSRAIDQLGRDFKEIEKGAEVSDRKYLTLKGLRDTFVAIGLDPDESRSIARVFDEFNTVDSDENLASRDIKGPDTRAPRGSGLPRAAQNTSELFTPARNILKRADAYAVLDDLKALSDQITTNLEALDGTVETLNENALLVRGTALSMLEITEQIDGETDALQAADLLRDAILKNARQALSQAENLEPIIVAALTLDEAGLVS